MSNPIPRGTRKTATQNVNGCLKPNSTASGDTHSATIKNLSTADEFIGVVVVQDSLGPENSAQSTELGAYYFHKLESL
jgi:hypothetical protein